ncbi:RNA-directed DNA polymerase from mobile element jockey [Trichonephila clavipes]|nr:RNA-directed DNA polymerase from mobile element jockey [Trichonephila clavipes]
MLQSPQSKRSSKYLRLLNFNINGLNTVATRIKLDQILEIADKLHAEIIALQETKLCEQRLLNAKGYNIVRRDRVSGITVHCKDRTITIKNLYHPPDSQHLDTNRMEGLFDDNTIILGDFNAKNTTCGSTITNARGLELSHLVNDKTFLCLNDGTHTFRSNSYGSTDVLDLTFISPGLFPYSSWRVLNNIGSDHHSILIEIDLKVNCTVPSNEETNAIISNNGLVSVDAREAAEALAQHYANESRLAFSSSDKHFARVARNQIKSCRDRPADNPLFNVDFTLPELSLPFKIWTPTNHLVQIASLDISCPTLEFWVGKDC